MAGCVWCPTNSLRPAATVNNGIGTPKGKREPFGTSAVCTAAGFKVESTLAQWLTTAWAEQR